MNLIAVEQGSDEWLEARLGLLTASRVADIMPGKRGQYLASREQLLDKLLAESFTKTASRNYQTKEMLWGVDKEDEARRLYELETGNKVTRVGIAMHPTIKNFGGSPDGLIGKEGFIEIKCPDSHNHMRTLRTGEIDEKYLFQMHALMSVTELQFCDFISYDPRFPEPTMQIKITRVERTDPLVDAIESEAVKFIGELNVNLEKLKVTYALEA